METETSTSKPFTTSTDNSAFTRRHDNIHTNIVTLLRPPQSHSSDTPWIFTTASSATNTTVIFRHPLTSKPHSFNLPRNPNFFSQLRKSTLSTYLASSYHFDQSYLVDTLLVVPTSLYKNSARDSTLLALYSGGRLQACPRLFKIENTKVSSPWTEISEYNKYDDITVFQDNIYAIDTKGWVQFIVNYKTNRNIKLDKTIIFWPVTRGFGRFGWRRRFAIDRDKLYLVVRIAEKSFRVYVLKSQLRRRQLNDRGLLFYWEEVTGFDGDKVLFMAKDYYFFLPALREFPGTEYKNCIVFSEAAFPQYGNDCWEFTKSGDRQFSEDDIAVFRLDDEVFAREGENSGFPKIDWSPPAWIFSVSSIPAYEFPKYSFAESSSMLGWELDHNREVQSDLKNSVSNDGEEQVEIESDCSSQDQDQKEVETDSDSQDQERERMQCDSDSQEKEKEGMQSTVNIEGDASLQVDIMTPFLSPVEDEVRRTLVSMNSGNDVLEEETSAKSVSYSMPKASTSSATKRHKGDSATTTFEGLDIRSDLVPTLQKIWRKHGNIIKDSIVHNGDIIAKALESVATMAHILEDNPAQSLSDSQVDYLRTTLSDLRCIHFKVCWLVPFVTMALAVHKSKSLVESLNNLSQLSSQVKARREILLDEVAKLREEENKLNEEMAKMSKMIPCSGKVKFDEPIGIGLT